MTDSIGIDATYEVAKEKLVLVIFVGVSAHGRSVILMAALVKKEDTETFDFCLKSFLDFGYSLPGTVLTDQDPALKASLKKWTSKHLYCVYHIYRNLEKNLGSLLAKNNKQFLKDFSKIHRLEDENVFEKEWKIFIQSYGIKQEQLQNRTKDNEHSESEEEKQSSSSHIENETNLSIESDKIESKTRSKRIEAYLQRLYKEKTHWAKCFTHNFFSAGMMSTQRNESINAVIKRKIKSYNRTNFMRVIYVVRETIDDEYIESHKTAIKLSILSKNSKDITLENSIYKFCAPYICKKVLLEVYRSKQQSISIVQLNENLLQISYKDSTKEMVPTRVVNLDQNSCSCKRIVFYGYPCWHLVAALSYKGVVL